MIESLQIDGFRGLDGVTVEPLGQFNLIVGPGNSGKTNLLEAIFLFCGVGDASLLPRGLGMRHIDLAQHEPATAVEFMNWSWTVGRRKPWFEIRGKWNGAERRSRFTRVEQGENITFRKSSAKVDSSGHEPTGAPPIYSYMVETVCGNETSSGTTYVTPTGIESRKGPGHNIPARYLSQLVPGTSAGLAPFWEKVIAAHEEDSIVELIRKYDSNVQDIRLGASEKGKALVRVHHKTLGRMPVEMLGAGFGKALAIACHLVEFSGGVLLLDEFDSSLHVAAQESVIQFAMEAAKRHGVQLFLSTHSLETVDTLLACYHKARHLWDTPADLRVLQLKRDGDLTSVRNLDADKARRLREELAVDLRRTG